MTKATSTAAFSMSNDATFRAWVAQREALLAAAGLVRTADTGQIDPVTVLRPGTVNTTAGYSMWRFDDALQGVAPVFIKFSYGTGGSTSLPSNDITVGTATDGAGNITLANAVFSSRCTASSTASVPSYATHGNGFFTLVSHLYASATASDVMVGSCVIQRTVDNTGAPTAVGLQISVADGGSGIIARSVATRTNYIDFATNTARGVYSHNLVCMVPGNLLDTRIGLDPQVFMHWCAQPKMSPLVCSATYLSQEIAIGNVVTLALVGTTPVEYMAIADCMGTTAIARNFAVTDRACMLVRWED